MEHPHLFSYKGAYDSAWNFTSRNLVARFIGLALITTRQKNIWPALWTPSVRSSWRSPLSWKYQDSGSSKSIFQARWVGRAWSASCASSVWWACRRRSSRPPSGPRGAAASRRTRRPAEAGRGPSARSGDALGLRRTFLLCLEQKEIGSNVKFVEWKSFLWERYSETYHFRIIIV